MRPDVILQRTGRRTTTNREIMGGDDCACELSLKAFEDLLAQGVEKIVIYASPREFTISGAKKKVKKKK